MKLVTKLSEHYIFYHFSKKQVVELKAWLLSVPYILDLSRNKDDIIGETLCFLKRVFENIIKQENYTVNVTEIVQKAHLSGNVMLRMIMIE